MNDTNISLQISLEKFNWAQVVNLGCKYLQKYTHKHYTFMQMYMKILFTQASSVLHLQQSFVR